MDSRERQMKTVFTTADYIQGGVRKSRWTRIGVGFVNSDGSITLRLDALPVSGTLHVREWESAEDRERHFAARRGADSVVAGANELNAE